MLLHDPCNATCPYSTHVADLSARATKGDINIDELSTAIQRGNRLVAFLSSGIAKIKAEIEDHAQDGITQSKPN